MNQKARHSGSKEENFRTHNRLCVHWFSYVG